MKSKFKIILCALICILSLTGCESKISFVSNTNGNVVNGSTIVKYEDFLYYSLTDGIYKMKTDGSERQCIHSYTNSFPGGCLNIKEDVIYFYDYQENNENYALHTMDLDGENVNYVCDSPKGTVFTIIDDYIYFDGCYRLKIGDTTPEQIYTPKGDQTIYLGMDNGYIYLCENSTSNSEDTGIYQIKLNGKKEEKISDYTTDCCLIDNQWIYFENNQDGNQLYKMDTSGKNATAMVGAEISNLNSSNDFIYCCATIDGVSGFYKINKNASNYKLIGSDGINSVQIIDNLCCFYEDRLSNREFHSIDLDYFD